MNIDADEFKAAIGLFSDSVSANNTFSLELLRAVDSTVESLKISAELADVMVNYANQISAQIVKGERLSQIDPDGEVVQKYDLAGNSISEFVSQLTLRRKAAADAFDLKGDHKAAVLDAYDAAISAYTELFSVIEEIRWAILEHDADYSPVSGTFSSADELIASIK